MLFGGKKERQVEELIHHHIERVGQVLNSMHRATGDYCAECMEFDGLAAQVMTGETEADEIRRDIERRLYDGAFMPIERGDYSRMVEAVDKVANQCEAVAQFLLLTRPELSDETKEGLIQIMDATLRCYQHIEGMFQKFEEGKTVMELAHKVEEEERNVDSLFAKIVSNLFESDLELARKIHVKMLLDRAAAISNRIEDASDCFLIIVSKRPT
jgi:predicted phosphate transport protein (TIGR00153 family)